MSPETPEQKLAFIRTGIAAAAAGAVSPAPDIRLIAISKTRTGEDITPLIAAGQRDFGENRVQEAKAKWPPLRERYPGLTLHLVGPLQTNKVREAAELFDVIHSLDREKLADALKAELTARPQPLDLFVQVNIGEEPQKAGIAPRQCRDFVRHCIDTLKLPVIGLMCIPPADENPAAFFALTRTLAEACGVEKLSMGMSGDFETAIRFGASHVRIGTALFGARLTHE